MNIITNFFSKMFQDSRNLSREQMSSDLIRLESAIGREVFGPVPEGVSREFFCLDENTWVWHENSSKGQKITRYLVQDGGVLKSVNGSGYTKVSKQELQHLARAAEIYQQRVNSELYNI